MVLRFQWEVAFSSVVWYLQWLHQIRGFTGPVFENAYRGRVCEHVFIRWVCVYCEFMDYLIICFKKNEMKTVNPLEENPWTHPKRNRFLTCAGRRNHCTHEPSRVREQCPNCLSILVVESSMPCQRGIMLILLSWHLSVVASCSTYIRNEMHYYYSEYLFLSCSANAMAIVDRIACLANGNCYTPKATMLSTVHSI